MSQLQFMAAAYEKAGDGAKLLDVLKRMVELDPDNIASSIKLGELYARVEPARGRRSSASSAPPTTSRSTAAPTST